MKLNSRSAAMRICVDRAADGHINGRVVGQRLRAPMFFFDVSDLTVHVDTLLDMQEYPKAFQRIRTFSSEPKASPVPAAASPEEMLDSGTVEAAQGTQATFLLYVTTRQNSTWQGFVDWLDGSPRQSFSSTLEFLKCLDRRFFG